ncbi:16200_t:CDS:10 [Entrophospora sp. SA101]|nr:16200_t:CDS:10 [Entrophospora sp. SA101]
MIIAGEMHFYDFLDVLHLVGKIDDLYVDFDNSWMLTGSSDRGIVARCNPKTGKVNKDLISTSGNIVRPISALLVDRNQILWGYETGEIGITFMNRNASERYYKKLYDYGSRSGCVTSLARDRKYDNIVVSGSSDGVVKLWDTGKLMCTKNFRTSKKLENDVGSILDLKEDIRNECEKLGEVTNVVLYDKEPEGIVSVKFKDQISAEACVLKMNGRFFAGRRVEAEIFDGKQKYQKTGSKSNETDEEEATRLEKYAKWLEEQNTGTASAKTNTINVDVGSDDLGASALDNRESETPDRLKWAPQGIEANNLVKENPEQNTKTTTENNLVNALRSFRNQNLLQTKQSAITEKDILINRPQQRSKEELRAKN